MYYESVVHYRLVMPLLPRRRPVDSSRSVGVVTAPSGLPKTLGELRAAGHRERSVKQEMRENLLTALADGEDV